MKAVNNPTGVRCEGDSTGDYYYGSRESLQRHQACPAGLFEVEGVLWKRQRTVTLRDGRRATLHKMAPQNGSAYYGLRITLTREQQAVRRLAERQACDTRQDLDKTKQELQFAEIRIRGLRRSAAAYRAEALRNLNWFGGMIGATAGGTFGTVQGGYRLDAEACNTVGIHLQAIRAAFETGLVVFDAAALAETEAEIMGKARATDPAFLQMLGQIASTGGDDGASHG